MLFSAPLMLILLLIVLINPYNHPSLPSVDFITKIKKESEYDRDERLSMAVHCLKASERIMFFGDSRTNQFFGRFTYVKDSVENRAFGGAVFNEIMETVWHSLSNTDSLDHILIGISFNHYSDDQLPLMQSAIESSNSLMKYITSRHQIKTSITILNSLTKDNIVKNPLDDPEFKAKFWKHQLEVLARQFYENMEANKSFQKELRELIAYCSANNIKVTLFSPPTHTDLQNLINVYELNDMFEEFNSIMNSFDCKYVNYDIATPFNENKENFNDPFHLSPETRISFYNSIASELLE